MTHPTPFRVLTVTTLALSASLGGCGESVVSIENSATGPEIELERGLLAYLRFDETEAGLPALDASGHGHDGTPSANPPLPSLSVPPVGFANPRSLAFDGAETLIDLGNPMSLDTSGAVTLSAWIRPLGVNAYRDIIAHGFRWMPDQELALRIVNGDYEFLYWNGVDHLSTSPVPDGDVDNWHHLAGVYDGQSYRLYRDGELLSTHPDATAPERFDALWSVGGRSTATPSDGRYFEGLIDEVRIYERALSSDEVRALFRR
jgi:hypothetical protein